MALANYSDLTGAVITWSRRNDIAEIIDDAIDLCEAEMYSSGPNGEPGLELRDMEARATATMDSTTPDRFMALPTGFLKMRRLKLVISGTIPNRITRELDFKLPNTLEYVPGQGIPSAFTVTEQLEFDINPDDDYVLEMQYWKTLSALTSSTTNSIMTRFPQIYLQGTLWAVFDSVRNEELAQYRYGKFRQAIAAANLQDKKGRYSPTPRMSVKTSTP